MEHEQETPGDTRLLRQRLQPLPSGGEGAGQTRGALYERFIDRKYSLEEAKQALADVEEPSDQGCHRALITA
jgi:hypothetical protein